MSNTGSPLGFMASIIPDDIAEALNAEANSLLAAVKPEGAPEASPSEAQFQFTALLNFAHVEGKDSPERLVKSAMNLGGVETARYFPVGEQWIGLAGENWTKFLNLCRRLHDVPGVADYLSLTIIVEAGFYWLWTAHDHHLPNEAQEHPPGAAILIAYSFTTSVIAFCEPQVEEIEVCIPLGGAIIETAFSLGATHFKTIESARLNLWVRDWMERWQGRPHPHAQRVERVFADLGAELCHGPIPVAAVALRAEPLRAVEHALSEVERTMAILRYYSPSNFDPRATSRLVIAGTVAQIGPRHLLLRAGMLFAAAQTPNELLYRPVEKFNATTLAQMRAMGLSEIDKMLRAETEHRTPWQQQILKAVDLYGRASLAHDVRDKLLYVVVTLESIFLRHNEGALKKNVSERLAYLLGQSLEHRRHIIVTYTRAYEARSDAVHRGDSPENMAVLTDFLNYAWHAMNRVILENGQYATQDNFLSDLDDMKFMP